MEIKYNRIGIDYNHTRKADRYLADKLFYHLKPENSGMYLDIGCGTGNYTTELFNKGACLIGIDPSEKMLAHAKAKNDQIDWRIGTAENTGLVNESIDGVIGSLTIHHWTSLQTGFSELSRILKLNGRMVIFTSTPEQMAGYWLNHYFPKMLEDSKQQMPSYESISTAMTNSGLEIVQTEKYFVRPDLEDHFLYSGKHRPELYLSPKIRNGISSFSDLSSQQEIENGLA